MNKQKAAILAVLVIALAGALSFYLLKTDNESAELVADPVVNQLSEEQIRADEEAAVKLEVLEINSVNAPMNTGVGREAGIKSGSKFGYIKSMASSGSKTTIIFDEARMLDGEEGLRAAREENGCNNPKPPEECNDGNTFMPNPYWISNPSKSTVSYTVSAEAIARIIDMNDPNIGVGIRKITLENLKNLISETEMGDSPFWLSFKSGTVTDIEQQYLP